MALDADRQLVVADAGGERLWRVAANGQARRLAVPGLVAPSDLVIGPDGDVHVADAATLAVLRIDRRGTATAIALGVGDQALGVLPQPLDPSVVIDPLARTRPGGPVSVPRGIGLDAEGRLVIADAATRRLVMIDGDAYRSVVVAVGPSPTARRWAAPGPIGASLTARSSSPTGPMHRCAGSTAPARCGRCSAPSGPTPAPTGRRTSSTCVARRASRSAATGASWSRTRATTASVSSSTADGSRSSGPAWPARRSRGPTVELEQPGGVAIASDGTLVVADTGNSRVLRIDASGRAAPVVDPRHGERFGEVAAVSLTDDGRVVVADTGGGRVVVVGREGQPEVLARTSRPDAAVLTEDEVVLSVSARSDQLVSTGPFGGVVLVAGRGGEGDTGDGGPAANARLRDPVDMARAPDGTLYLAERGGGRLRRITPDGRIDTVAGIRGSTPSPWAPTGPSTPSTPSAGSSDGQRADHLRADDLRADDLRAADRQPLRFWTRAHSSLSETVRWKTAGSSASAQK